MVSRRPRRHNRRWPIRLGLIASSLAFVAPARAGGPLSAGLDCGPDAFSSAQVIEGRPPRRGPLTALPGTLCTDLAPQGAPTPIDIHLYPGLGAPVGRPGPGDPYEGRPPRYPPRP